MVASQTQSYAKALLDRGDHHAAWLASHTDPQEVLNAYFEHGGLIPDGFAESHPVDAD